MPGVGHLKPIEGAQKCRFPTPGRANDAYDFAAGDIEVDTLQHFHCAEGFADAATGDDRAFYVRRALGRLFQLPEHQRLLVSKRRSRNCTSTLSGRMRRKNSTAADVSSSK